MKNKKSYTEDSYTGFLLYAATLGLKKRFAQALAEGGCCITPDQHVLLTHLWREDGISQSDLAARSFKDRHNVSRIIKSLEEKGVVTKVSDEQDARLVRCVLSEKGRSLQAPSMNIAGQVLAQSFKDIREEDIITLRTTLMQLLDNLEEG